MLSNKLAGVVKGAIWLLLHKNLGRVWMVFTRGVLRQNRIIGLSGTRPKSSWLGLLTATPWFSLGSIKS